MYITKLDGIGFFGRGNTRLGRHHDVGAKIVTMSRLVAARGVKDNSDRIDAMDEATAASIIASRSFTCTQCGKCCTGSGEVWLSAEEAKTMSSHLNLSMDVFLERYTKKYARREGWYFVKQRGGTDDCIFLEKDQTSGLHLCRVHQVRPTMCRTYPWWPPLLNEDTWQEEKETTCEGFDHDDAPEIDLEQAMADYRESVRYIQEREGANIVRKAKKVGQKKKGFGS